MQKHGFSIKYKLLFLLVVLPTTMLALYIILAMKIFKTDKIAYVYDTSDSVSKTLAAQTRAELESVNASLKPIWTGYDENTKSFDTMAQSLFKDEEKIKYIGIYQVNGSKIKKLNDLSKTEISSSALEDLSTKLVTRSLSNGFAMIRLGKTTSLIFLATKTRNAAKLPLFATVIIDAADLVQAFDRPSSYSSFLMGTNGEIVAGPDFEGQSIKSFSTMPFYKKIKTSKTASMTMETDGPHHKKLLLSYSQVGQGDLSIISLTEKDGALQAVKILLWKSILFFVALISFSIIISVYASQNSTKAIRELFNATKKVSQGNFNIKVNVTSNDEIGSLANSFNQMGVELQSAQAKLQDYANNLEIKVEQRTAELAATNRNLDAMVNSLGQGFLIFNSEGICSPLYSKACLKLLEGDPSYKPVWTVLKIREDKIEDFKNWVKMLFPEPLPFTDMIEIAPKTFEHEAGRHITLEYFPVRNPEKKLTSIVLVATDKTEELEATLLAKREGASAKRVLRIIKNRDQFKTFVQGATKIFDQVSKLLSKPKIDQPTVENIFQLIHTLKGDSGTFMLDFTFEKAHFFENKIQDLKAATDDQRKDASPDLLSEISVMKKDFDKFIGENREIVGDPSQASKTLEIPFRDLSLFFSSIKDFPEVATSFQEKFLKEPIGKFFGHYNDLATDVAQRREKKISPISFKGSELRINAEPYLDLFSTFVHAIRNSIDHGIESPDARTSVGKNAEGLVTLEFSKEQVDGKNWIEILFKDDGKGIDPKVIREKLTRNGVDVASESDEQIIQHIFDNGFSTRDSASDLSGRGVGMGAIKAAAEQLGGNTQMKSQVGVGTTLIVKVPEIEVPVGPVQNITAA